MKRVGEGPQSTGLMVVEGQPYLLEGVYLEGIAFRFHVLRGLPLECLFSDAH